MTSKIKSSPCRMHSVMGQLRPGDHTALFYRTRHEQLDAIIPYIQIGLERNESCLYIAGDTSPGIVRDALDDAGIDVSAAERNSRLTIATPNSTYLRYGVFEPVKMVEGLKREVQSALDCGCSAFRGTGELGWAAALPSALLRLYEYEAGFDAALSSSFIALCQYDETLFGPEIISQMLRVHPKVVARGRLFHNPFYVGAAADLSDYPLVTVADLLAA